VPPGEVLPPGVTDAPGTGGGRSSEQAAVTASPSDSAGTSTSIRRRFACRSIAIWALSTRHAREAGRLVPTPAFAYVSAPAMQPLVITDPRHVPRRKNALDRLALRVINDERDLPFVYLCLAITFVLLPFAVYLYLPGRFTWWLGAIYLAVNGYFFFDRFILMLHNTSHRIFFKREHVLLNKVIPWLFGPLFGETPDTYFVHHVGMHHAEENMWDDLSSTLGYKRDSVPGFLHYWARFFFGILPELGLYNLRRKRWKLLRMMLIGELLWYGVVAFLLWLNWEATLFVLVIPFVLVRFLMMAGNWAQHAFVDIDAPDNKYRASIVCINTRYNRRCFNDGYHIGHHLKATRHWTEMPEEFEQNRKLYADNDAVVFQGIDYFQIWLYLMLKRYDWLAERFVELRDEPRSKEEIIALLRARTRPLVR
jgi:hypothetical protein